jgi:membrane protein HdeD
MLLIVGLVLLSGVLYLIPAVGKYLEKLAKWLGGFQTIIGIVAIVVALWQGVGSLSGIMLLVIGIILAIGVLTAIPAMGKYLAKMVKFLGAFHVIIGIIAIILAFI